MFQQFIDQAQHDFNALKTLVTEHVTNNTNFVQSVVANPVETTQTWFTKAVELNTTFAFNAFNLAKDRADEATQAVKTNVTNAVKKTARKS